MDFVDKMLAYLNGEDDVSFDDVARAAGYPELMPEGSARISPQPKDSATRPISDRPATAQGDASDTQTETYQHDGPRVDPHGA